METTEETFSRKAPRSSLEWRPQSRRLLRRRESPLWQPRETALKTTLPQGPRGRTHSPTSCGGRCRVMGGGGEGSESHDGARMAAAGQPSSARDRGVSVNNSLRSWLKSAERTWDEEEFDALLVMINEAKCMEAHYRQKPVNHCNEMVSQNVSYVFQNDEKHSPCYDSVSQNRTLYLKGLTHYLKIRT